MFLTTFLQEHGQRAIEHGTEAAAGAANAQHAEHIPIIVEKLNDWLGPAVFGMQKAIMPQIYHALKIFGDHWPGEGKTYEQYLAAGELPIPTHVVMFLFVVVIALGVLTYLRGKLSAESPTTRQQTFEVGVELIRSLLIDLVGPGGIKHFPIVATFGLLILLSNLTGMLPDMVAPTANFNMTLALAVTSFLYYNYVGIRENGFIGYLKHFAGPVPNIIIMAIMFPIEIVSNLARVMSLSVRLFGNMFGEEQLSGAISSLVQWVVPALLMPLGLLTSVLQAFIFMLLSMVYLGEVSSHSSDHHETHAPGATPAVAH